LRRDGSRKKSTTLATSAGGRAGVEEGSAFLLRNGERARKRGRDDALVTTWTRRMRLVRRTPASSSIGRSLCVVRLYILRERSERM